MNTTARSPDWIMVGGQISEGRIRVIASKDMSRAELEMKMDDPHFLPYSSKYIMTEVRRYFLTAEMRKFVIVEANSYNDAFQHLFQQWNPDDPTTPELESQKAIEG